MSMLTDWHLVNLIVPALLPVVLLSVLSLFKLSKRDKLKTNPIIAIKDGQLAWAGLGMCVNGLYELRQSKAINLPEAWSAAIFWAMVITLIILTVIAALAPVFTTPVSRNRGGFFATILHYRVMMASALLTIVAAWLYSEVHFTIQALTS